MHSTVFERLPADRRLIGRSLAPSILKPFWLDDQRMPSWPRYDGSARYEGSARYDGSKRYDLAVVGGGYTGLWTALLAKQRDPAVRVAIFEAKTIGWAASGRNGGFCEESLTHGEVNGENRFAAELPQLQRLGRGNLDEIEATVKTLGFDCDFERTGSIAVATEEYQVGELRAAHDGEHEIFFDADAIRLQLNSPSYLGGLWSTRATALVHPAKLAAELARACAEAGVDIFEHSPVAGIDSEQKTGPVTLTVRGGFVTADKVALATNAFPSLLKRYRLHTVPVYDYVLMTEPLTDSQLAEIGWSNRQGVADSANQFHYYRLSADNRILWGGYDAVYHYGGRIRAEYDDRRESFERLASHFFTTFPQLEGITFTHRWAGVIDTSTRFCAFFGQARQNRVSYAAGFTGLGVGATRFAANVMLDQLSGEETERTQLAMVRELPLPFPPEPAASVGVAAMKWALDRADHNQGRRNLFLRTMDAVGLGFDS